ncbi:MAG: biotin/lipoate--protein ligase family protein [Pseudomonadota bacterium]
MAADDPTFPPLLTGEEAPAGADPFDKAVAAALTGCDAGLLVWSRRADALSAAVVLAPECPLEQAVGISFAVSVGLVDALGALAPPEVAVHHVWPGAFKVNGADCGFLRGAASTSDTSLEPDWLVFGIEVPFLPTGEGGEDPTRTCLFNEGCAEITPQQLLESWSRHMLVWINRWLDEGLAPLHAAWRERAWEMGEALPDGSGTFMGLDELGGMLVKSDGGTTVRPLTDLLDPA